MANPTSAFGWQMPTNTDLVKDLPSDFEIFGQAVDDSLADLKGGTTGQVLSKTSGTDLDFTWITPTDQIPLTTKGDLLTFTTVDARLGVGADGTVLTADSAEASGLKWSSPSSGSMTLLATGTLSGASTTISSISGSYKNLVFYVRDFLGANTSALRGQFNGDTGANYQNSYAGGFTYSENSMLLASQSYTSGDNILYIEIPDYANTATPKMLRTMGITQNSVTPNYNFFNYNNAWNSTAAITSFTFKYGSGNLAAGTYYLYGVN